MERLHVISPDTTPQTIHSTYLRRDQRISPPLPNRHIARIPIENLDSCQVLLDQLLPHLAMGLHPHDLILLGPRRQQLRELASSTCKVHYARVLQTCHP